MEETTNNKWMKISALITCSLLLVPSLFALSNAELAKRQARSVHLTYEPVVRNALAAMATGVVTETQTNSYFMILGWDCGYCGVQDSTRYGRIFIFSVWDPGDPFDFKADPTKVKEDVRAQVVFADKGVDVARFGGEGTGIRTITDIGWNVGEPVSVRIEASASGTNRTAYACFVRKGAAGVWRKIASVSTLRHKGRAHGLNGVHSFIEDFWRNGVSATRARRAEYYDIGTKGADGAGWTYATRAYFTGDATESAAVDAGRLGERRFFLQTGGATTNATTRLFTWIDK